MRKKDIYEAERAQGKTYQEIADMFGVTRQAVYNTLKYHEKRLVKKRWPRLLLWMEQNNVNQSQLAKMVGVNGKLVYFWLTGRHDPSKYCIDRLLLVTGLTYEELFAE